MSIMANTEDELFAMNKKEQIKLLKDLGIQDIPSLEKDRVKLILEIYSKQENKSVDGTKMYIPVDNLIIRVACPNCGSIDRFINVNQDRNEYICNRCEKGYSGYPPPKGE